MANASFRRCWLHARRHPAWQQPFGEPERHRRTVGQPADELVGYGPDASGGTARCTSPQSAASVP